MVPTAGNLLEALPDALPSEVVDVLAHGDRVRIERIVSRGQRSPEGFWYDQEDHEWVLLVTGAARLVCEGQAERALGPGDWVFLPAHTRHRVTATDPTTETVWLAVFFSGDLR